VLLVSARSGKAVRLELGNAITDIKTQHPANAAQFIGWRIYPGDVGLAAFDTRQTWT
jgi:hypothetical protein